MIQFKTIVMDPPWPEQGAGKIKRGADRHYPLIKKKEEILEVIQRAILTVSPAKTPAGVVFAQEHRQYAFMPDRLGGCHLWLWTTNNYLEWGLWLMEALGFKYKNVLTWVKAVQGAPLVVSTPNVGLPVDVKPLLSELGPWMLARPGLGQYTMGQTEQLLFGTCGKAMKPNSKDRPRTALMAPRPTGDDGKMIHSAKPQEAYDIIEKVSPGPRMEMFARAARENWAVWGNEV